MDTDTPKFDFLERIGQGSFGDVWKVKHKVDGSEYALKKVAIPFGNVGISPDHLSESLRMEILHMSKLRHPNIVGYNTAWLGKELVSGTTYCCNVTRTLTWPDSQTPALPEAEAPRARMETVEREKSFLYIQMELCTKDLSQCIADGLHLDRNRVWKLLVGIIHGLQYIHEKGIIHRDMKPGNILLGPHDQVKIADFGISRSLTEPVQESGNSDVGCMTRERGTDGFMAPEVQGTYKYTTKADMYSLGVVLSMMMTATRIDGFKLVKQIHESALNDPPESLLDVVRYTDAHLIARLVQDNATYRPNCNQLLRAIKDVDRYGKNMSEEAEDAFTVDARSVLLSLDDHLKDLATKRRLTAENLTQKVAAGLKMDLSEADWVDASETIKVLGDSPEPPADPAWNTFIGIRRNSSMNRWRRLLPSLRSISEAFENEQDVCRTIERLTLAKLGLSMEVNLNVRCPNRYSFITECTKTGNLYCLADTSAELLISRYTSLWVQNATIQLNKRRVSLPIIKLMFVEEQYSYIVAFDPGIDQVFLLKHDIRHTETFTDGRRHVTPVTEKLLDVDIRLVSDCNILAAVNVNTSITEHKLIYIMVSRSPLVVQTFTLDGEIRRSINISWPRRHGLEIINRTELVISDFTVNSRGEIIITAWEKELVDDDEIFHVHLFNVDGEYEREIATGRAEEDYGPSIYVDRRDYLYLTREEKLDDRTRRTIDILDPSCSLIGRIRLHDMPMYDIVFVHRNGDIVLTTSNIWEKENRLCIMKHTFFTTRFDKDL